MNEELAFMVLDILDAHGRLDLNEGQIENLDDADKPLRWTAYCRDCGEAYGFEATLNQMKRLVIDDVAVQDVFPDMEPEIRDVVRVRGVFCPSCNPIYRSARKMRKSWEPTAFDDSGGWATEWTCGDCGCVIYKEADNCFCVEKDGRYIADFPTLAEAKEYCEEGCCKSFSKVYDKQRNKHGKVIY